MAMNVGSPGGNKADPEVMVDINTTPADRRDAGASMIMLIITIPIQTHAVKLNMPNPNSAPPPKPPEVVNIDVDFDGTVIWNGDVVPDRANLEERFRGLALQADQPEVHLRPNKLVTYKYVAMVMASAQRLGVTKIGLVGNEQFVQ